MGGKGSGRRPPFEEGGLYQRWGGKRTKLADVITAAEVDLLEELVAPLQTDEYCGPDLGTQHVYPARRVSRVSGHEPPDWLIEQRRLERYLERAERGRVHALAMALDQAVRERTRYRAVSGTSPPLRQAKASYALIIRCGCGHKGHALVRPGQRLAFRCSQCGERQEL